MAVSQQAPGSAGPDAVKVRNPYSSRPNWLYPSAIFVVFTAFVVYGVVVGLFETSGRYGPYLSPFFSPEIYVRVGGFLIPPGIWIAPFPLAFRLTCYYYRKAYFRSFLWHPRSCAVQEPHRGTYRGETRFWIFNNLHRFALYAIVVQMLILLYDAIAAFYFQGNLHFGLGNVVLVVNVVLLSGYTFGCHALRHLVGGSTDCMSCHRARYRLWKGVTVLNVRHELWAWLSMFSVWGTDVYIRLLIHGVLPHAAWN
ncbi:MAG TPA: hypothetical protein VIK45_01800 [Candidatus Dormibacteraeota bacterium]